MMHRVRADALERDIDALSTPQLTVTLPENAARVAKVDARPPFSAASRPSASSASQRISTSGDGSASATAPREHDQREGAGGGPRAREHHRRW